MRVLQDEDWPDQDSIQTQHAGLFLLVPELIAFDLPAPIKAAGWPSTNQVDATHSVSSLLALKLSASRRRGHVRGVVHDPALGLFAGPNVLRQDLASGHLPIRHQSAPSNLSSSKRWDLGCATPGCLRTSSRWWWAQELRRGHDHDQRAPTLRQIAVNGLGREHATLILTNQTQSTVRQLVEHCGHRWGIESQLAEQIRAFRLDSLYSY